MCANFKIMHGLISMPNFVIPIGIAYCKKTKTKFQFEMLRHNKIINKVDGINQCDSLISSPLH